MAQLRIDTVETFVAERCLFVRITTDTGIQGIGESTAFVYPQAVAEIVAVLSDHLVGADPLAVEHVWQRLYRAWGWRGIALGGAISAIDQALWDIRGRHWEEPVWQLLGGRSRNAVRAMKVIPTGSCEDVVTASVAARDEGFTAIKVLLHQGEHHRMGHAERIADLVTRFAAIREAVGDGLDIGIELHRNMQPGNSVALIGELARFRPLFVEDPIPPDSALSFGEVSAKVGVPMAAGERNTTVYEFREYVERGGISFVRPDVGIAGGFTQVRKICALAEAHHQGVLPHAVPNGPVATMAHVHLGLSVPNWEAQEYVELSADPYGAMVDRLPEVRDGHLYAHDAPGLGMSLAEDTIAEVPAAPLPVSPDLRPDGSVALR